MRTLRKFVALLLVEVAAWAQVAPGNNSGVIMEDFATLRTSGGTPIYKLAEDNGANSTDLGLETEDGNSRHGILVDAGSSAFSGEWVNYRIEFITTGGPWGYPGDHWGPGTLKSGTWDTGSNVFEFWFKCTGPLWGTNELIMGEEEWYNANWGTYSTNSSDAAAGLRGTHFYHYFHGPMYNNLWKKYVGTWKPDHELSTSGAADHPPDPHVADGDGTMHYFDGLTVFYFSTRGDGTQIDHPMTCYMDNLSVYNRSWWPHSFLGGIDVSWDGTNYHIAFSAKKSATQQYDIRWSPNSMTVNGFTSGTVVGSVNAVGAADPGLWITTSGVSHQNIYFAIRPTGETEFAEVYFPTDQDAVVAEGSSGGSSGPSSRMSGGGRWAGGARVQ